MGSCCAEVHTMSGKVPAVSVVGGKGRGGFEPLPSGEPPALIAARKSREQKNAIIVKIGAVVVIVTAAVASLAAFLITRGDSSASLSAAPPDLFKGSRMMSDKISAVNQVAAVAKGNTVFGSRLYQQLKDEPGNIIMSPFSVSGVMAMVAAGAGGETLSQVQQGMSFPSSEELALGYKDAIPALRTNENFTLEAANSIFAQSGFAIMDAYRETLHQHFHAAIQETDYSDGKASAKLGERGGSGNRRHNDDEVDANAARGVPSRPSVPLLLERQADRDGALPGQGFGSFGIILLLPQYTITHVPDACHRVLSDLDLSEM